jgi:hypothetical protein
MNGMSNLLSTCSDTGEEDGIRDPAVLRAIEGLAARRAERLGGLVRKDLLDRRTS